MNYAKRPSQLKFQSPRFNFLPRLSSALAKENTNAVKYHVRRFSSTSKCISVEEQPKYRKELSKLNTKNNHIRKRVRPGTEVSLKKTIRGPTST